jgi:hypothetical protein
MQKSFSLNLLKHSLIPATDWLDHLLAKQTICPTEFAFPPLPLS